MKKLFLIISMVCGLLAGAYIPIEILTRLSDNERFGSIYQMIIMLILSSFASSYFYQQRIINALRMMSLSIVFFLSVTTFIFGVELLFATHRNMHFLLLKMMVFSSLSMQSYVGYWYTAVGALLLIIVAISTCYIVRSINNRLNISL
jgi:hypothetical protein